MKIALYGKKAEVLKQYKESLENKFDVLGKSADIDYYIEEARLQKNMKQYDIIVLSNSLFDEFKEYISDNSKKNITFVCGKTIETCLVEDILYVEADLKKVHLWKEQGEVTLAIPISKMEILLKQEGFIKTHRSYIVNSYHISSITTDTIILDNGTKIPVSKYRIKDVREQYLNLMQVDRE